MRSKILSLLLFLHKVIRQVGQVFNSGNSPSPLTHDKFLVHCQVLSDNPQILAEEFQLLQSISSNWVIPTTDASLPQNKIKNRYSDILPYDFSRVLLNVIDNDPTSDYINASFIKGITDKYEYIACQGPKEGTAYDFWRMIDQYDIKLIVMLTKFVENGKEKCYQYFPNQNQLHKYNNISVKCVEEYNFQTWVRRKFILQKDDKEQIIIHMQYQDWPDHGVPDSFDPINQFCHTIRKEANDNEGLIVVHCSAGIGRTGTLIAIDILMQQIKENTKLDIFGTVSTLRSYRFNMVQTSSQYGYIYFCVRQILQSGDGRRSSKEMLQSPSRRKSLGPSSSEMGLINHTETITNSSTSSDSKKLIYDSPWSTPQLLRSDTSKNNLRPSKSTSAIYTKLKSIPKFGSYNFPIYEFNFPSESNELENKSFTGSTDSLYENVAPLSRSKTDQTERNYKTHEWLEKSL